MSITKTKQTNFITKTSIHHLFPPKKTHRTNNDTDAPKLTPEDTKKMHQESVDFLKKEIFEAGERGEEVVVLTHHCPVENLACSHPNEVIYRYKFIDLSSF